MAEWEIAKAYVFDSNVTMEDVLSTEHRMISVEDLANGLSHRQPSAILADAAARREKAQPFSSPLDRKPSEVPTMTGSQFREALKEQRDRLRVSHHRYREYQGLVREIDTTERRTWAELSQVEDIR